MKIIIEIETKDGEMSWARKQEMAHTIAVDVATMLNEKHEEVYRTTHLFTERKVDL